MTVVVHVWSGEAHSMLGTGHAAIETDEGYLSFHPNSPKLQWKELSPFCGVESKLTSLAEDEEKHPSGFFAREYKHERVSFFHLDEDRVTAAMEDLGRLVHNKSSKYNLLLHNCSTAVALILNAEWVRHLNESDLVSRIEEDVEHYANELYGVLELGIIGHRPDYDHTLSNISTLFLDHVPRSCAHVARFNPYTTNKWSGWLQNVALSCGFFTGCLKIATWNPDSVLRFAEFLRDKVE